MNPESIIALQNRIEEVEQVAQEAVKKIKGIEIDNQRKINANVKIPPGIACKVAYDANGLVLSGDKLNASDIPTLTIDAIDGLRKALDSKLSASDARKIQTNDQQVKKSDKVVGTGIKVNFDENGWIVSVSDLIVDDVPALPIEHIINLREELNIIKSTISPVVEVTEVPKIAPGTFTKITYDETGRVLSGSKLTTGDIPIEVIEKINHLEEQIPLFAPRTNVDSISKILRDKLDANNSITPGTYTKMTVDSKGLITKGDKLTIKDLPAIGIDDVNDLSQILRNKADQSDLMGLNDTVSSIVNSLSKIGDITAIQNKLERKAEDQDVRDIASRIESLQKLMDTLSTKIPNELIMEQLQQIQNEVSTISGRLSVLEKKMGIDGAFDPEE